MHRNGARKSKSVPTAAGGVGGRRRLGPPHLTMQNSTEAMVFGAYKAHVQALPPNRTIGRRGKGCR